ncbi:hypothetical protein NL676_033590 [Syzygium grande]|nr:hypothetical protein NL676_033590 [Syzygium grande]
MDTEDVVLMYAASESQSKDSPRAPNLGPTELVDVPSIVQSSYVTSPSDRGIPPSSTAPAKPAEEKSRESAFEVPVHPSDAASVKDGKTRLKNSQSPCRCSPEVGSPHNGTSAGAAKENHTITVQDTAQQTQSKAAAAEGDEHVCCPGNFINMVMWAEWVAFVCVTGLLIVSLTGRKLQRTDIWELELWKWCVLGLAIFSGRLVRAAIWLIKTLLIKLLAASFHKKAFFKPIHTAVERQHVIDVLSGKNSMEQDRKFECQQLSFTKCVQGVSEKLEEVIDAEMLTNMKQRRISPWDMRRLISSITGPWASIFDSSLDHPDQEIIRIATETANEIFTKAGTQGDRSIDMKKKENVAKFIPLIQGPKGDGMINKPTLEKWLVTVYRERRLLADTLKDADTVIDDLDKLVSVIVLVVITIVSLLIMGLLTTETLIFISSQLLLVVFMFGNTARTVFEAVIFVFVTHPFDVEDRCVIDGVQLVVKKMGILTTTFVRYDGEKIYYPNSVLATKPISNFNRSDEMGDSVEFTVDFSTSVDSIAELKEKVKTYLKSKPDYWIEEHSIVVKEIEDVNKLKMGLYVTHTINFQNSRDRNSRRSELVLELKRIFEEVGIKYRLLPQEVQVSYAGSAAA